jgi:hypothetical protein
VPVIVTVKAPLTVAVQDRVEVPEPVTLVGARVQVIPVAGLTVAVKLTTPAKPFTAATVIVEVPAWLTLTATLVGLAAMVKSWTTKVTVVDAELVPLVPVTVTVYVAAEPEQDSVDVPLVVVALSATVVGDSVQVRPVEGETEDVRLTVPVNPPCPVTVIVEVDAAPALTVRDTGLADRVKLAGGLTLNVTVTE